MIEHKCALVGMYYFDPPENLIDFTECLIRLQHRGQAGTGVAMVGLDGTVDGWHSPGLVRDSFKNGHNPEHVKRPIKIAIGHHRYATSGSNGAWQPFPNGVILAHNGNITNTSDHYQYISPERHSALESDSQVIHEMINQTPGDNLDQKLQTALPRIEGAYSLVMADPLTQSLYGARDPWGIRPLYLGKLNGDRGFTLASEPIAFQNVAENIRAVRRGEVIKIQDGEVTSVFTDHRTSKVQSASCIFEPIYFASAIGELFGLDVAEFRRQCGAYLADQDLADGFVPDLVVPIRNSGTLAAEGYSHRMIEQLILNPRGYTAEQIANLIPQTGIATSQYAGRVFIGENRERNIELKFTSAPIIEGKKIVTVDDSNVRGDTAMGINELLRRSGVSEIHSRYASDVIANPCHTGMDFPDRKELVSWERTMDQICEKIGADSIRYMPIAEIVKIAKSMSTETAIDFCTACFTGKYPVAIDQTKLYRRVA